MQLIPNKQGYIIYNTIINVTERETYIHLQKEIFCHVNVSFR